MKYSSVEANKHNHSDMWVYILSKEEIGTSQPGIKKSTSSSSGHVKMIESKHHTVMELDGTRHKDVQGRLDGLVLMTT